eukprot:8559418-Pyramimonas_sp.AAC.1
MFSHHQPNCPAGAPECTCAHLRDLRSTLILLHVELSLATAHGFVAGQTLARGFDVVEVDRL